MELIEYIASASVVDKRFLLCFKNDTIVGLQKMPAPPEIRRKLIAQAVSSLEAIIDDVWDQASAATRTLTALKAREVFGTWGTLSVPESVRENPFIQGKMEFGDDSVEPMSPQKRGAQHRAPKGLIKGTIKDVIYENGASEGLTVAQIRDIAHIIKGVPIKEGSMKQGLRLLQKDRAIERRGLRYFPTKNGGQSND